MSMHHPDASDAPNQPAVRDTARVACLICQALYVPAPTHTYLLQAPPTVLESAFMSMCHFCFRCRRPACPGCWDDVHGICGNCALETHLPFRAALAPLQGSLFAATRRAQIARVLPLTTPLVCVRPGRFQRAPLPIDTASTVYMPALPLKTRSSKAQLRREPSLIADQTPRAVTTSALASPENDELDIAEMVTRPEPGEPSSGDDLTVVATPRTRSTSFVRWLERLLTTILLLLFLVVVALIAAALLSLQANAYIISILHVDIRTELANLWQLIRRIHF